MDDADDEGRRSCLFVLFGVEVSCLCVDATALINLGSLFFSLGSISLLETQRYRKIRMIELISW